MQIYFDYRAWKLNLSSIASFKSFGIVVESYTTSSFNISMLEGSCRDVKLVGNRMFQELYQYNHDMLYMLVIELNKKKHFIIR